MLRIKYKCWSPLTCFRIGGQPRQLGGWGQYWRSISLTWPFLNRFQRLIHQNAQSKYKCGFPCTCFRDQSSNTAARMLRSILKVNLTKQTIIQDRRSYTAARRLRSVFEVNFTSRSSMWPMRSILLTWPFLNRFQHLLHCFVLFYIKCFDLFYIQ